MIHHLHHQPARSPPQQKNANLKRLHSLSPHVINPAQRNLPFCYLRYFILQASSSSLPTTERKSSTNKRPIQSSSSVSSSSDESGSDDQQQHPSKHSASSSKQLLASPSGTAAYNLKGRNEHTSFKMPVNNIIIFSQPICTNN